MSKREIPWLLIASIIIVIAVQVLFPKDPDPINGIVENKTVIGISDGKESVIIAFTIYGTNSSIENWEEIFNNGTSINIEMEEYLKELYDEIQYKMMVGYKEDMDDYLVSRDDFNKVEPYEIIFYVADGKQLSIREVVRSSENL